MKKRILGLILALSLASLAWTVYAGWIIMQPTMSQSETIKVYCPANMAIRSVAPPQGAPGEAIEIDCFWITTQTESSPLKSLRALLTR